MWKTTLKVCMIHFQSTFIGFGFKQTSTEGRPRLTLVQKSICNWMLFCRCDLVSIVRFYWHDYNQQSFACRVSKYLGKKFQLATRHHLRDIKTGLTFQQILNIWLLIAASEVPHVFLLLWITRWERMKLDKDWREPEQARAYLSL